MANALYDNGREGIIDRTIDMTGDVRIMLVKSTYTFSNAHKFLADIGAVDNGRILAGQDPGLTRNNWELTLATDSRFFFGAWDTGLPGNKTTSASVPQAVSGGRYNVFAQCSSTSLDIWINGTKYTAAQSMAQNGLSVIPSVGGMSWVGRACASLSPVQMMWSGALNDAQRYALMDNPWQVFR